MALVSYSNHADDKLSRSEVCYKKSKTLLNRGQSLIICFPPLMSPNANT